MTPWLQRSAIHVAKAVLSSEPLSVDRLSFTNSSSGVDRLSFTNSSSVPVEQTPISLQGPTVRATGGGRGIYRGTDGDLPPRPVRNQVASAEAPQPEYLDGRHPSVPAEPSQKYMQNSTAWKT